MTDRTQDDNTTNAPAGKPTQAEGSRKEAEEAQSGRSVPSPAGYPSQAEGSREQIEQDIEEKLGE